MSNNDVFIRASQRSVHSQPPTQVTEQQQSQQRASVTRSLPPPSRASVSRTSAPPEPLAHDDRSLEQAEQGQSSLDSVPEEVYEEYHEAPMVRPSHPYARRRGRAFSVGGLLGKLVHALYLFGVRSVTLFFWAISEFTRVVGKTLGMTLKPVTFVTDMPTTPLLKGAGGRNRLTGGSTRRLGWRGTAVAFGRFGETTTTVCGGLLFELGGCGSGNLLCAAGALRGPRIGRVHAGITGPVGVGLGLRV